MEQVKGTFTYYIGGRRIDGNLIELDDFDRDDLRYVIAMLKPDERLYRYTTPTVSAGGMCILLKVNLRTNRLYFLTERGYEEDVPEFESSGIKAKLYLN